MRCFFMGLGLCLALSVGAYAQEFSCPAIHLQTMCDQSNVAGRTAPLDFLPAMALNPVNLHTGQKHLRDTDYYPHPHAPDLEIVRHYRGMVPIQGELGLQWQLSYQVQLKAQGPRLVIQFPNGNEQKVVATELRRGVGAQQIWQHPNGAQWHFDAQGWLVQLQFVDRGAVHIYRHSHGQLAHHIDYIEQNQQRLNFYYQLHPHKQPLLSHIQTPSGKINYGYSTSETEFGAYLQQIHYPDERTLYYHYEPADQADNRWALTGKSLQLHPLAPIQRMRRWSYNPAGQVIHIQAENAEQWVHIDYDTPLKHHTQLRSVQGTTGIQFSASKPHTIQWVRGAACWACPPAFERHATYLQFAAMQLRPALEFMHLQLPGWPDLKLHYNTHQGLTQWSTHYQQPIKLYYDALQRPQTLQWPNQHQQQISYNAQGRVHTISYYSPSHQAQTQLHYPSPQHLHIQHPTENEQLHFNAHQQLLQRSITRYLPQAQQQKPIQWHYTERYEYNAQQQLIKHHLPEGGTLHYTWQQHQLQAIYWENKAHYKQLVGEKSGTSWHYANGLMRWELQNPTQHYLYIGTDQQLWWQQFLHKSPEGLVQTQHLQSHHRPHIQYYRYGYNRHQQLVLQHQHLTPTPSFQFWAWYSSGLLAAHSLHPTTHIQRDTAGLASAYKNQKHDYKLQYNALGRLAQIDSAQQPLQTNYHNAAGFRIYAQHHAQQLAQFFLYDQKKLVAEYTTALTTDLSSSPVQPVSRRYVYYQHQPVAMIDYSLSATGELFMLHSDHLGAVQLISDAQQQLRWAADYDAWGAATQTQGDLQFNLRREGQYYDLSTGWHDNLYRIYLPHQGHYLEPDPLGPQPTSQLFGYAQQQPLNHVDPWGLVMFAFDGTRYDQSSGGVIHALHQLALDYSYYSKGPGSAEHVDWDAMVAYSAQQLLNQQWTNLLSHFNYLQNQQQRAAVPIDIIGFSRGGALAIHFANQIMRYTQNGLFDYTSSYGEQVRMCIQPRFMGLIDSVAQMGLMGSQNYLYDFSLSPAWQWVVHAVALHERRALFPLLSLGSGDNLLEAGFIGSHADLGGGYTNPQPNQPALSHISLQWLLWHAQAQGLSFTAPKLPSGDSAYLHQEGLLPTLDRQIELHGKSYDLQHGFSQYQYMHPLLGQTVRDQVKAFINYDLAAPDQGPSRVATVDLNAYYAWLDEHRQWEPIP